MIVVFQPHRYTRTEALFDRFVISFNEADVLLVTSIFSAGEAAIDGVTGEWLSRGIKEHGHKDVIFSPTQEDALSTLLSILRPGDLVITLGAGDIHRLGPRLLDKLD